MMVADEEDDSTHTFTGHTGELYFYFRLRVIFWVKAYSS